MRTLKLTLAYDGGDFIGWQRQPIGQSIQGELERAFKEIEGKHIDVHGAGRTDAGVHALAQVASVSWPAYEPVACPQCAQGIPAVKPGSRPGV